MARTDDEREFRLRPPNPRVTRNEGAAWSNGFNLIMHYARSSRKTGNRARRKRKSRASVLSALRSPGDVPEEQGPRAMESAWALGGAPRAVGIVEFVVSAQLRSRVTATGRGLT